MTARTARRHRSGSSPCACGPSPSRASSRSWASASSTRSCPSSPSSSQATPVQTELLFTSYLLVTGLAMLVTSWVSSRIGAKATLLVGLGLIVVFATLCALSGSVDAVIAFRGGWGLGNALFISTALATIVGAATGGSGAAIVLYEAALGLGIAIGPLLGRPARLGQLARAVLRRRGAHGDRLHRDRGAAARPGREARAGAALGADPGAAPARARRARHRRAVLQHRILRAARLLAVPARIRRARHRPDVLRLGRGPRDHERLGRPDPHERMPRTTVLLVVLPLLALDLVAAGSSSSSPPALVDVHRRRRPAARGAEHRAHGVRDGGDGSAPVGRLVVVLRRAVPRRRGRSAARGAAVAPVRPDRAVSVRRGIRRHRRVCRSPSVAARSRASTSEKRMPPTRRCRAGGRRGLSQRPPQRRRQRREGATGLGLARAGRHAASPAMMAPGTKKLPTANSPTITDSQRLRRR